VLVLVNDFFVVGVHDRLLAVVVDQTGGCLGDGSHPAIRVVRRRVPLLHVVRIVTLNVLLLLLLLMMMVVVMVVVTMMVMVILGMESVHSRWFV